MRILIVGAEDGFAIENFYSRYLQEAKWEVLRFDAPGIFYKYYRKSYFNKLLFKAGLSAIYYTINKNLQKNIEVNNPDVVWIFKGMEIFPKTLKWIRERKIVLVNFNADNPFIFTGKGSGNSNITHSVELYGLHFTYNLEIKQQLEKLNPGNIWYLPFGFDLTEDIYSLCKEEVEIVKTCFLGNPDKKRAEFIQSLAGRGVEIDLYGNNWTSFVKHDLIKIYPEVRGIDFWKILRKYRVQLNLMRIHSVDSHNMRTFEVPGVGGIMLAKKTTEHSSFFAEESEVFFYSDEDSCVAAIHNLLKMDNYDADKIRDAARSRSLKSGYKYKDRALFVSHILRQYLEKNTINRSN